MKRGRGRPKADLSMKLQVFEKSIASGAGIVKSLSAADIPVGTYYNYLEDHPEYVEQVEKMQIQLAEIAEESLVKIMQINVASGNPEIMQKIIDLAKWLLKKRKPLVYGDMLGAPPQWGGVNVNLGTQNLIRADELTDDQLQRMAHGEKLQNVLEGKVIASAPKNE